MERTDWLAVNRAALEGRLAWLKEKAPGVLFFEPSGAVFVVVDKVESHLRLYLAQTGADLVQSRLDLADPLYLVSPYTQAAMLALAWNNRPRRVGVIGLGGGRLPLVWHHYLPRVTIDCVEIDRMVITAATRFFGLQADERLRLFQADGREYLAGQAGQVRYDLILVDAFAAQGDGPYHLATREFYRLCRDCLAPAGLVVVNLLQADSLYAQKIKTLQTVFEQVYLWPFGRGNGLAFALDGPPLVRAAWLAEVDRLQAEYAFPFPFVERALELKMGPELAELVPGLKQALPLADKG